MRWLFAFCFGVAAIAMSLNQSIAWSSDTDRLTRQERVEFIKSMGDDRKYLNAKRSLLRKVDLDADGRLDIVLLIESDFVLTYKRTVNGYEYGSYVSLRKSPTDTHVPETAEILVLPSLNGDRKDILVRGPLGCAALTWIDGRFRGEEGVSCSLTASAYLRRKADCHASAGSWAIGGLSQSGFCRRPTPDAGTPCTDRKDCTSLCVYRGPPIQSVDSSVVGECLGSNDVIGCHGIVKAGKPGGRLCID